MTTEDDDDLKFVNSIREVLNSDQFTHAQFEYFKNGLKKMEEYPEKLLFKVLSGQEIS